MLRYHILTLFLLLLLANPALAQFGGVNPATIAVDNLSDDQIIQIWNRAQQENMSVDDVITVGQAQGLPAAEAQKLRTRLNQAAAGQLSSDQVQNQQRQQIRPIPSRDAVEQIPDEAALSALEEEAQSRLETERARRQIYGHSIFTDQSLDILTTTDAARAPDTYILGTGDQVRVIIFGTSQADLLLEISEDGYIQPTGMPRIFVKGLSMREARLVLRERLSAFYQFRSDEIAINIRTARTITINVFGETENRGGFTISALNTAFNALTVAGGPTETGSVRNIRIIRGAQRSTLDVYQFLQNPTAGMQMDLQHNDILFVPVAEKIVRISGSVKRPMRYELKDNESLLDLIQFAGGINYDTSPDFVQVQRVENGEPVLMEWKLSDILQGNERVTLQDGDIVRVRPIARELERFVEIDGAVFYPGRYNFEQNQSLRSLVDRAGLREQANMGLVFVERQLADRSVRVIPVELEELINSNDDFPLERRDNVLIFSKEEYRNVAMIEVTGTVRFPFTRELQFDERLKIGDAIQLAGGLQPTAADRAYIFRTNLFNPTVVTHIPVNLSSDGRVELQPGDRLVVYDQSLYVDGGELAIRGAVNNPVDTNFDPNITVTDLLIMANGFQRGAATDRIDIFRVNISIRRGISYEVVTIAADSLMNIIEAPDGFRLQPFDKVVVRRIPEFNFGLSVELEGEFRYTGNYPLENRQTHLSQVVRQAGGLTSVADQKNAVILRRQGTIIGPIAVDLSRAIRNSGDSTHDPVLFPDDVITVPRFNNTVAILVNATRVGELRQQGVVDSETTAGVRSAIGEDERLSIRDNESSSFRGETEREGRSGSTGIRQTNTARDGQTQLQETRDRDDREMGLLAGREIATRDEQIRREETTNRSGRESGLLAGRSVRELESGTDRTRSMREAEMEEDFLNSVNVVFRGKRSARWYIENFGGGFAEDADRWSVTVTLPNGEVRGTKRRLLFFRNYPTVEPGSTISLRLKPEEMLQEESGVDLERVLERSLQTTTSLLTLLLLLDQLNR